MSGRPGRDDVEHEASDHDHGDDDHEPELELEIEEESGHDQAEHREQDQSVLGHDRVTVGAALELEEGLHRVDDDSPVHCQGRDAGCDQEHDARPDVGVGRARVGKVRSHDEKSDSCGQEPDAGTKAHEVGSTPDERGEGDPSTIRGQACDSDHAVRGEPPDAVRVEEDVCDRSDAEESQVARLHGISPADQGVDHAFHRLRSDPRKSLVLRKLRVLDDQDLAQEHHGHESDQAGDGTEDRHVPNRVWLAPLASCDHDLSREEVGDEAQATACRPHGCHDRHLRRRDFVRRPEVHGEEDQRGDCRPFLHDPERQRQIAVYSAEHYREEVPRNEAALRKSMLHDGLSP